MTWMPCPEKKSPTNLIIDVFRIPSVEGHIIDKKQIIICSEVKSFIFTGVNGVWEKYNINFFLLDALGTSRLEAGLSSTDLMLRLYTTYNCSSNKIVNAYSSWIKYSEFPYIYCVKNVAPKCWKEQTTGEDMYISTCIRYDNTKRIRTQRGCDGGDWTQRLRLESRGGLS